MELLIAHAGHLIHLLSHRKRVILLPLPLVVLLELLPQLLLVVLEARFGLEFYSAVFIVRVLENEFFEGPSSSGLDGI